MTLAALTTELTDDPLTRGYSGMDDAAAAADLNTAYRDGDTDIATLFNYMLLEETHNLAAGDDTQDRAIWLRIKDVAEMTPWNSGTQPDPWGGGSTITEIRGIKCRELYEYFTLALQGNIPLALTDTNFGVYLAGAQAAGCMSTAQETAIKALSQNKTTRGNELGLGTVREGHVQEARL